MWVAPQGKPGICRGVTPTSIFGDPSTTGLAGTGIRELAASAGVSVGVLWRVGVGGRPAGPWTAAGRAGARRCEVVHVSWAAQEGLPRHERLRRARH